MSTLKNSLDYVVPILEQEEYKSSFKEVIYYGYNKYDYQKETYKIVNHSDYINNLGKFENPDLKLSKDVSYFAFGIVSNIFYSKLLLLDFDNCDLNIMLNIGESIIQDNRFNSLDIIMTNKVRSNYHMIIGMNDFYSIRHILPLIPSVCQGFVNSCLHRGEAVLRVSQKFYKNPFAEIHQAIPIRVYNLNKQYISYIDNPNIKENKKSINLRG
jgi:hypothetical protein